MAVSSTDNSHVLAFAAISLAFFFIYKVFWPVHLDSQEPPILRPKIPFIGHLLSLAQLKYKYHARNQYVVFLLSL